MLLKEHSLTTYYDDVALKGIQLAANDAQRGGLEADMLEQLKGNLRSLFADLDPPPR